MTSDNHAEFINEQYESGARQERKELPKRQRMAKIIQDLLAQAELASKRNDETARDEALAKAAALQLKFAIDDAMLAAGAEDKDELAQADFCTESNTPLIKAKRELINGVAQFNRGKAVMMGEWKPKKGGGRRYDRRAKVTVFAHQSDLDFITMLYNSLILQMQTMMASDEAHTRRYGYPPAAGWQAWRVSYAYGWVRRVVGRIAEAKRHNEAQAEASTPGHCACVAGPRRHRAGARHRPVRKAQGRQVPHRRQLVRRACGRQARGRARRPGSDQTRSGKCSPHRVVTITRQPAIQWV